MSLLALLLALAAHPPVVVEARHAEPRFECKAAYGEIECGYDCTAAYGSLQCAQTPRGRCVAAHGELRCFDPPRARHLLRARRWPQATCESANGTTACGYDCTAAYGVVKCAQTPAGKCVAAYGEVKCVDPRA
jgi:hypothetical protein